MASIAAFIRGIAMSAILIVSLCSLLAVIVLCVVAFRVTAGPSVSVTSRVNYLMVDLGRDEPLLRRWFELLAQNRKIYLEAAPVACVYVSKDLAQQCWPESPFKMRESGHAIELTCTVKKLLLVDGYGAVRDVVIRRVVGVPAVIK
jgi:hypothetical protein